LLFIETSENKLSFKQLSVNRIEVAVDERFKCAVNGIKSYREVDKTDMILL